MKKDEIIFLNDIDYIKGKKNYFWQASNDGCNKEDIPNKCDRPHCKCHTIIISNTASVNCIENPQNIIGKADITVHEIPTKISSGVMYSNLKSFSITYYINGLKCYYWQAIDDNSSGRFDIDMDHCSSYIYDRNNCSRRCNLCINYPPRVSDFKYYYRRFYIKKPMKT